MKSNKKRSNQECLSKKRQSKNVGPCTMDLKISEDGRAIVDANGSEIARFREGLVVRLPKKCAQKLPGHMVCKPECIRWDNHGNCIQYIQSCTWEFPPFDF